MAIESTQQGYGQRTYPPPAFESRRLRSLAREYGGSRELRSRSLEAPQAERLALGLGWFSIGLGVAQLFAPRAISRLAGYGGRHTAVMRLIGLRELACGVGILASRRPDAWL